jgi:hypothetical protein
MRQLCGALLGTVTLVPGQRVDNRVTETDPVTTGESGRLTSAEYLSVIRDAAASSASHRAIAGSMQCAQLAWAQAEMSFEYLVERRRGTETAGEGDAADCRAG